MSYFGSIAFTFMKDLRLTRLILALSITDAEYVKQQLKLNSNRFYLLLFTAIEQLSNIELTREEIYLRVYKKKWNAKLDATFRTDLSRLADFIEDTLDPEKNGFGLSKAGSFRIHGDYEVWTDGESMLIPLALYKRFVYYDI